jgi:3-phenylpropionate/trans-cinnamate dioxygenase ferredoxin subunit
MTEERICAVGDVPIGEARRFDLGSHHICVVHLDGDFYAIGDVCTHQDISLAEGEVHVDEREIECWKHGSTFSLVTGEPQSLPATRAEPVYDLRVDGDDVYVVLP